MLLHYFYLILVILNFQSTTGKKGSGLSEKKSYEEYGEVYQDTISAENEERAEPSYEVDAEYQHAHDHDVKDPSDNDHESDESSGGGEDEDDEYEQSGSGSGVEAGSDYVSWQGSSLFRSTRAGNSLPGETKSVDIREGDHCHQSTSCRSSKAILTLTTRK